MTSTSPPGAWGLIIGPAALALLIALLAITAPAQAAFPGANGKIAFQSSRDGDYEIYVVDPDGTHETRLTNTQGIDSNPAWSPVGAQIAFASDRENPFAAPPSIYVMNADGTDVTLVAPAPGGGYGVFSPAWSPDGSKIAFERGAGGQNPDIWLMNANGTGQTRILADGFYNADPSWSPDGQKIAFTRNDSFGNTNIYVMNADGTNVRPLTNAQDDRDPDWSPDGSEIVFTRRLRVGSASTTTIYKMNADGSGQLGLTNGDEFQPAWSPDGTKIAFVGLSGREFQIYMMNADGTGRTKLTSTSHGSNFTPSWQPLRPPAQAAVYTYPTGASPMRIPFIPAFEPCAVPNASHNAPLSASSCNAPSPRSSLVAVGPRSLGFLRLKVLGVGECTPFNPNACYPDLQIGSNITDVRSGSPSGSDYDIPLNTQDLTVTATLPGSGQGRTIQVTDQYNRSLGDSSYDRSATVVPLAFPIPLRCSPTSDPAVGSTCDVETSANSLLPGSVVAGKRAIWEIGQLQFLDPGANGVPGDYDDDIFEVEGVFIP